jgi:hypothetical protein
MRGQQRKVIPVRLSERELADLDELRQLLKPTRGWRELNRSEALRRAITLALEASRV